MRGNVGRIHARIATIDETYRINVGSRRACSRPESESGTAPEYPVPMDSVTKRVLSPVLAGPRNKRRVRESVIIPREAVMRTGESSPGQWRAAEAETPAILLDVAPQAPSGGAAPAVAGSCRPWPRRCSGRSIPRQDTPEGTSPTMGVHCTDWTLKECSPHGMAVQRSLQSVSPRPWQSAASGVGYSCALSCGT
jgi:hypothetical protein